MPAALRTQLDLLPGYLSGHLLLTMTALVVGISVSLPLAVMLTRMPRASGPVMTVASAIQTIPGLALLALMVPILGRIGFLPAVVALVLYSMLPVLRNTVTGVEGVDADLVEAGRGLGMTDRQLLMRVQLPLAMPVIIAGVRTATVWVVGLATLSTPVGATSLGNYIFTGLQTQNYAAVLVGCVAAAALALCLDGLIRAIERAVSQRKRLRLGILSGVSAALLVAGLWPVVNAAIGRSEATVLIGTKTFTEQYILGQVMATTLARAGFATRMVDSLGSTVAFEAVAAGNVDVYVDYTGTVWTNYMKQRDNPGRRAIFERARAWLDAEHGIAIAANLGFENAYAFAMPAATARELHVTSIEDLANLAPRLKLGGDYEFFARPEWEAVETAYGLHFADLVSMDSTLMYGAVAAGEVDVISAFSTDGRIPAYDLVVLDDPREALPPYDAVVLVSHDAPAGVAAALTKLDGAIDVDAMREANREVDIDGLSVAEAAAGLAGRAGLTGTDGNGPIPAE
jgi:osmoprotectant transport system permease protein